MTVTYPVAFMEKLRANKIQQMLTALQFRIL